MADLRPYRHVSLLLDGNGRWACQRGLPRTAGHTAGAANLLRLLPDLAQLPIGVLSVYVFSTENWGRPAAEVAHILEVIENGVRAGLPMLVAHNIRLHAIGELARLPDSLQDALATASQTTRVHNGLRLILAISYGGRREIVQATQRLIAAGVRTEAVDGRLLRHHLYAPRLPNPDIILRTAGEQHLSNWMVWQGAGAILRPIPVLSPDLTLADLRAALWGKG